MMRMMRSLFQISFTVETPESLNHVSLKKKHNNIAFGHKEDAIYLN